MVIHLYISIHVLEFLTVFLYSEYFCDEYFCDAGLRCFESDEFCV